MIRWLHSLFTRSVRIECCDTQCQIYGIDYRPLYRLITQMPGVVLPRKPRFFWTGPGIYAEFIWKDVPFQIEGDLFDDALWISPKDGQPHPDAIQDIREHLKRSMI